MFILVIYVCDHMDLYVLWGSMDKDGHIYICRGIAKSQSPKELRVLSRKLLFTVLYLRNYSVDLSLSLVVTCEEIFRSRLDYWQMTNLIIERRMTVFVR